MAFERVQYDQQEIRSREYEREFVGGATPADLDLDLVRTVGEKVKLMPGASPEKVLQYLDLAKYGASGLLLRRAALLLFAQDVNRWHPRCEVRIIRAAATSLGEGRDHIVQQKELVRRNILKLLSAVWDELRPHLAVRRWTGGRLFAETLIYPEGACVEGLINAVAHRDYSIEGRGIEVLLLEDRMEIKSPGELLSTTTVDQLKRLTGVHQSRNPYVARVLRELGYMRELGEGIPSIFRAMEERDLTPPDISSESGTFALKLFHRSVFSAKDQLWLESYRNFNPSRAEEKVLLLGRDGHLISPIEIRQTLKISDTADYAELVRSMSRKGLIYSVRPADVLKMTGATGRERREIGRFALRPLGELEHFFGELVKALQRVRTTTKFARYQQAQIRTYLSPRNPYGKTDIELLQSLRYLGLIDQQGLPTERLTSLCKTGESKG